MFVANGLDILVARGGHGVELTTAKAPGLVFFGYGEVFGIPVIVLTLALLTAVTAILMSHTAFGKELRAVGLNSRGARFSGVNVRRDVIWAFVLAGTFYGLAGFLLNSRLIAVPSRGGEPYFLGSYAVVYLGSAFMRGEPNIVGTLVAAFFMSALQSGFAQIGLPFYFQSIMTALVIILTLTFSLRMLRRVSQG
jgi:ribose transport system permease protein